QSSLEECIPVCPREASLAHPSSIERVDSSNDSLEGEEVNFTPKLFQPTEIVKDYATGCCKTNNCIQQNFTLKAFEKHRARYLALGDERERSKFICGILAA